MLLRFSAILLIFFSLIFTIAVRADDSQCDPSRFSDPNDPALTQCLADFSKSLQLSVNATKPLVGQLESLQRQLAQIQATIDNLVAGIAQKQKDLDVREEKIALQQALLEQRVKAYYIRSYLSDPLLVILSSVNSGDLFRELSYRQSVTREDKSIITSITQEVVNLLTEKDKLEKDKARLAVIQADVDKNATFLGGEIKKAKAYQSDLSKQIASLSQRQQDLIAAKLASLNISRSAYSMGRCDSDLTNGRDPGFSPKFAAFTYGVPNRVGLNQYGAWGRAKAGESAEQILADYYPGLTLKKDYDRSAIINVDGYSPYNVEEYVKRIYEMPAFWTDNGSAALKAQAVAARSYGLAHRGGICTTESCQVFKPDPKTDNNNAWINAVNDTAGWVLVDGTGNPASTQYSSTHGGYILNLNKFDGVGGNPASFSDLANTAYDKASPWFYCDWGSRGDSKTAWLRPEELADIVNVLMLAKQDSGTQVHLSQVDKPNPDGQDTWNADQVKQELRKRGGTPFNGISGVSVFADFGSGRTTTVTVSGDGRSQSFSGGEFKNYFNLRAPANINIVGPLFNIERK